MNRIISLLALMFTSFHTYAQIYTYDANNKLTKVEYGNGVTVSYEYDVLGNRTSKTVSGVTAQSFKVTVKASPKEYGSVDGGGTYSEGANVELNAVPSVGFEFEKWSDGPTDNPRTIMVTKDVSYTALFKVKEKNQEESGGEIGPGGVDLGIYDTNGDGVVNQYDLDAIIDAYLEDAPATPSTDLDDDGEITIADISMMVAMMNDMHTGEYNGHEYVDLGLPSGTLWATCNLGATSSEESGCYYAWGETTGSCEGKTNFSWRNYKYCNGVSGEGLTKYNNDPELGYEGYTDDLETLEPADDAATANWGGKWRMPTREDINELRNKQYTKWTFATHNGVKGFVVTSIVKGYVGNSIFLPAEGGKYDRTSLEYIGEYSYYWSSSVHLNSYGDYAKSIVLRASGTRGDSYRFRCEGLSIRPVVNLGEVATGSDSDLSNGLVAYYPFNGNANDESGHGNHGTPMSSVTLTTGVNGDANGAYKFGGCDNPGNIHIPNSESLIIDDGWSFATFVNPTSYTGIDGWGRKSTTDGMHAIMGKDHDQSGFSIQYRLNSDSLHVWLGCTSGWTKNFGASIYGNYLNQWVHVSITYSNSIFKVYINGQKRAEAEIQANFSVANTKDLYLGKYRDSWYPMDGVLDEVRIYNRALSDDEIKQLAGEVNLNSPVAEAIDLGLPSGTKWASWNIGASSPEDCGGYYAWGETEEKDYYDWSTYTHCDGTLETCHHIGDNIAGTEYDVARMKWGDSWTMPSTDQIKELMDNCERTWTSQNGTNGMLFTGPNGNSIFLPAAGWRTYDDLIAKRENGDYWSSELNMHHEYCADGMGFDDVNNLGWTDSKLFHGRSVRAVCSPEKPNDECPVAEAIDLGLPSGTKWASWNVGASKPEEYGGYYAWGETEEKDFYSWGTYELYNGETNEVKHIGDDIAGTEYDVAHVKWGSSWRMPSFDQIKELLDNCTRSWTQQNGVNGTLVTGPNGNTIFLPAAGYRHPYNLGPEGESGDYWSSLLDPNYEYFPDGLYFGSDYWKCAASSIPFAGLSVRAVCPSPPSSSNITFADTAVKAICVANWDTNKDGELSIQEAATVKSLGKVFYEKQGISTFNELQYFTGLTIIEEEAFRECSLKSVSIPKSVKTIGEKAFMQCPKLSEVTLPEGVAWIDEEAFSACALTSITLPESLIRLGEQALEENPLVSVTLPRNVAYLGNSDEDDLYGGVFDYCYSLKEVNVDESNNTYASIDGVLTTKDRKFLLFFPYGKGDGYVVPEGIEQIHYDAFNECKNTSVTLPSTLKSFYTDEDEENYSSFSNNFDLRTVRAKMKVPFECGYYSFADETYSSGTLYVPQGTKTLYETTTGWSRFQHIVEEDGNCPVAEAIDLGLPSGTKWASWNVGASKPEEYGGYYAWGETEEKDYYDWDTYAYGNDFYDLVIIDEIAGTEYDVAHVKWGGSWCMPSDDQIKELLDNCTQTWTNQNGINGILVTGPNGNSIFLPAAGCRSDGTLEYDGSVGYYWHSFVANGFGFNSFLSIGFFWNDPFYGYSVRAVCP